MINTDRYEGHTPGPWKLDWPDDEIIKGCMFHIISDNKELLERFECKPSSIDEMEDKYKNKTDAIYDPYITSISCGPLYTKDGEFISEINARLIADAPLLLAEVLRLREALLLIANTANGRPFVNGHIGLPLVHEVLKELIDE